MISRALLNAPFFIPKDADLLRNRKVNTKKRQNRHLPELAFLILGTYFTAPIFICTRYRVFQNSFQTSSCSRKDFQSQYRLSQVPELQKPSQPGDPRTFLFYIHAVFPDESQYGSHPAARMRFPLPSDW